MIVNGKLKYTLDGKDIDGMPSSVDVILCDDISYYSQLAFEEMLAQVYDVDLSRPYVVTDMGDGRHRVQQPWVPMTLEDIVLYGGIRRADML